MGYWNQFDSEELNDMHGIVEDHDDEDDYSIDEDEEEPQFHGCPQCQGSGCSYCLL